MLEIIDLHKRFGSVHAVDGVSLTVAKSRTVVLMGPSGCGKSTTIRCINRLTDPDQGQVRINGIDILKLGEADLRSERKHIGFVFQQFNLLKRLTALENVMFGPVMSGMGREQGHELAIDALRKVGMENHADRTSAELSGGQQQRVAIARVLAMQPKLMLWDEPTASLDPILVREVLVVMEELAKYNDSTMVVVTHELSFALHVADEIVLMEHGRIVEQGSPAMIFKNPSSAVGERYKQLIEYQINTTRESIGA